MRNISLSLDYQLSVSVQFVHTDGKLERKGRSAILGGKEGGWQDTYITEWEKY